MTKAKIRYGVYDVRDPHNDLHATDSESNAVDYRNQLIADGADPAHISIRRYGTHHAGNIFPGSIRFISPAA